jgi:hypothetical protein
MPWTEWRCPGPEGEFVWEWSGVLEKWAVTAAAAIERIDPPSLARRLARVAENFLRMRLVVPAVVGDVVPEEPDDS